MKLRKSPGRKAPKSAPLKPEHGQNSSSPAKLLELPINTDYGQWLQKPLRDVL